MSEQLDRFWGFAERFLRHRQRSTSREQKGAPDPS
jgi:hypothetical protein